MIPPHRNNLYFSLVSFLNKLRNSFHIVIDFLPSHLPEIMSWVIPSPQNYLRPVFFIRRIKDMIKEVNYCSERNITASKCPILARSLTIIGDIL